MENKDSNMAGRVATLGDAAEFIGGTIVGFAADSVLFVHSGIPPFAMSGYAGTITLLLKKGFEDSWTKRRNRINAEKQAKLAEKERKNFYNELRDKEGKLREFLLKKGENKLLDLLNSNLDLWDAGIIDDKQFAVELEKLIKKYRTDSSAS